jgi:chromosome partitioning protein
VITIAIINQKGGVGKTTTAVTLAHGLAMAGAQTVLVDLDAQGNCADALGLEKGDGLYRLLFGDPLRAVTATGRERLSIVLSDKQAVEAKNRLAGEAFREQALRRALRKLNGHCDVCVLDSAPGVDVLQVGALVACDYFLIPVALDHLAVIGAGDALASAATLTELGGSSACGRFLGILPTMWERTTNESHEQLESLVEQFGKRGWPPIPLDVKAREAPAFGKTLWEYAPRCRAIMGVEICGVLRGGYRQVLQRLAQEVRNGG